MRKHKFYTQAKINNNKFICQAVLALENNEYMWNVPHISYSSQYM